MYGLLAGSNLDASSWLPFSDISQQRRVGLVWFPIVHVSIPDSFPHCPQLHHKKWLAYRCSCWDETRHLICEFREWLFDWDVQVDSWICGVHGCGCCIPCQCPSCQRFGGMNLTSSSFSSNYLISKIAALRLWIRTRYGDPAYFKFNGKMLKNDDLFSDECIMFLNC